MVATSFDRKVARAEAHIDAINALFRTWRRQGYRIREHTDSNGITTEFAQLASPLPEDIPLLIGDAAQCLFNALDHLAFAIASRHPDGLTQKEEAKSAFPISPKVARNDLGVITPDTRVAKWPPCAITVASVMQPYLSKKGLNDHPLWLLRDLANRDKHREIPVVVFGQVLRDLSVGNAFLDYFSVYGDQEIGTEPVPLVAYSRRNRGQVGLRREFVLRFGAGPLIEEWEVVRALRWIAKYVREVPIQRLAKFAT